MTRPDETVVRALLDAHGLSITDDEVMTLARDYSALRASLDALHEVPMSKEEDPQSVFSPVEHQPGAER